MVPPYSGVPIESHQLACDDDAAVVVDETAVVFVVADVVELLQAENSRAVPSNKINKPKSNFFIIFLLK